MIKQLFKMFLIHAAISQLTINRCARKCKGKPVKKVCGYDKVTYKNKCLAECAGTTVNYPGTCLFCPAVLCSNTYIPVCGVDGLTHKNFCQLICLDNVCFRHNGACKPKKNCICTKIYLPVRGVDGVCYGNQCLANCSSMKTVNDPPCLITLTPAAPSSSS